jgi:hypothetical protein
MSLGSRIKSAREALTSFTQRERATAQPKFAQISNLLFICIGLCAMLFVGLAVLTLVMRRGTEEASVSQNELDRSFRALSIPSEDLFLPDEPDFLPGIILEREPRGAWSSEDARPFWKNPSDGDEAKWRERISSTIDELLEGVP